MVQNPTPEFYLSLLSGRYGGLSHLSTEERHNDVGSCLSCHPFPDDPERLMDLLDAFAAICVRKATAEVFFVSLAMESKSVTLYVSSNNTVPPTVIDHLCKIWRQLQELKAVLEFDSANSESLPNPNYTQSRTDGELKLQKTIYEYSYNKLHRRFSKRGIAILQQYDAIMKRLEDTGIAIEDTDLLVLTHRALQRIGSLLQNERPPLGQPLTDLIHMIDALSLSWRNHLKDVGDEGILTRWDNLIHVDRKRTLSLRRLLNKLFTLHNHIHTITRIAWSHRLSPVLEGKFNVVSVPAARRDISIEFSQRNVLPIIFPSGKAVKPNVETTVYNELLKGLQAKADEEGIDTKNMKKETLSMKVNVHAECTLLAYHLQHPEIDPYHYFGGSKLSCHGCSTFFSSFNLVAKSFGLSQFFTKGCHSKISLRWPCPSLLSEAQQIRLRSKDLSLDAEVRKGMVAVLGTELATYVDELCVVVDAPSPPLSDSTAASGDSRESQKEGRERLRALLGM